MSMSILAAVLPATEALLGPAPAAYAAGGGRTPPPNRDGTKPGDNTSCPPGPDARTKGVPDPALGDKDVDGDGRLDYFMGEWKFVDGDADLTVRQWCINKAAGANFNDFFTYELIPSVKGVDQPDKGIKPRSPI